MTIRTATAAVGIAALGISALVSASPPAQAAQSNGKHCVGNLQTGAEQCFSTLDQALGRARSRVSSAEATAQGEVIQGTFFDNRDYGGDSYTVVGAGLCDGSDGVINYQFNFPEEWFNRISSVQPWAGCKIWLYPEVELGGDRDGPFKENTGWIGPQLDDRTRSVGFS